VVLRGVAADPSEPSGLETDMVLYLRLVEDWFFFKTPGLDPLKLNPPGDAGGMSAIGKPGVAGEALKLVSAGLKTGRGIVPYNFWGCAAVPLINCFGIESGSVCRLVLEGSADRRPDVGSSRIVEVPLFAAGFCMVFAGG
jgi:hypothetical protein